MRKIPVKTPFIKSCITPASSYNRLIGKLPNLMFFPIVFDYPYIFDVTQVVQ